MIYGKDIHRSIIHRNQEFFAKSDVYMMRRKRMALKKPIHMMASSKKRVSSVPKDMDPQYLSSPWAIMLNTLSQLNNGFGPCITSREGKLFRRRFRIPYQVFLFLSDKCRKQKTFGETSEVDFDLCGRLKCPIEIKLLGTLRILGRNWCFDDVAEATGLSAVTVQRMFHLFCKNFVEANYETYIHRPEGEELASIMAVYKKMGLPGCTGSSDVVHVKWDRCPLWLANLCCGKEGFCTLAFSVTVDHCRKILATTCLFYGAKNDKSIVRFDTHITDIRENKVYKDVEYEMYDEDGVSRTVKGGTWIICDGGYHKWVNMICGIKHPGNRADRLWSEWMESTRKDVECTFGIYINRDFVF